MTTTQTTQATKPASTMFGRGTGMRVTQSRVVVSEWTKFRSVRSTVYTLLAAVVFMLGLGALFSAITAGQPGGLEPGQSAVSTSLSGTIFAQLAIGVLGVLLISGEYSTGMIRSSLTVVPRRLPMLWGKLAVFTGVVFLTMLIASLAAFFVGQLLFSGQHLDASLSDPGVLRSVVGSALYLTVAGVTALASGALLLNTSAAITNHRTRLTGRMARPPMMAHRPANA
jgi:ABC-type transport system involved in multi-copper enzyme maturation permease subunit